MSRLKLQFFFWFLFFINIFSFKSIIDEEKIASGTGLSDTKSRDIFHNTLAIIKPNINAEISLNCPSITKNESTESRMIKFQKKFLLRKKVKHRQ